MNDLINIHNWAAEKGYTVDITFNVSYTNITVTLSKDIINLRYAITEEQLFNGFEIATLLNDMDNSFNNLIGQGIKDARDGE